MKRAFRQGEKYARSLDEENPLRTYRDAFYIPDDRLIYLDGNSLGRLPLKTRDLLKKTVDEEWGSALITSWNRNWYDLPHRLGEKLALIIGAGPDEVVVTEATSTNLYKLAFAALDYQQGRNRILTDDTNFPSDLYILQGITEKVRPEAELVTVASGDGLIPDVDRILDSVDEHTALVCLSHVCFKSAYQYDIEKITREAHRHGSLVLWDLSHSAGITPVKLNSCRADLAVGCTYKYLNGGPGAPAYLYVRKDLQERLVNPVRGWFSSGDPFDFKLRYQPAGNINRFQVGTPPVLSMRAVEPGLDMILEAGLDLIREQSVQLTEYLRFLVKEQLEDLGISLASPADPGYRGSHLALRHPEAYRIAQAMIKGDKEGLKIIADFRAPDILRLGIAPLYNTYRELYTTAERIRKVISGKEYLLFSSRRNTVT